MSGQDEKFSKKNKEKKFQVKLTLTQKQINRYEEYRMKNKLKGSLQEAIQLAADREVTGYRLIGEDKELLRKLSFIKTALEISADIVHNDKATEREVAAIQEGCCFLREYVFPRLIIREDYVLFDEHWKTKLVFDKKK